MAVLAVCLHPSLYSGSSLMNYTFSKLMSYFPTRIGRCIFPGKLHPVLPWKTKSVFNHYIPSLHCFRCPTRAPLTWVGVKAFSWYFQSRFQVRFALITIIFCQIYLESRDPVIIIMHQHKFRLRHMMSFAWISSIYLILVSASFTNTIVSHH